MRLEDDGNTHSLGKFQMLDVTEEEKSEQIQPESIEGETNTEQEESISTFKTNWISKQAQYLLYTLGMLITLLFAFNVAISIYDIWQIHWVLGMVFLIAVAVLIVLSVWEIYKWIKGKNGVELVDELQEKTSTMTSCSSTYSNRQIFQEMHLYYSDTPQEKAYSDLVRSFPDYLTDKECLEQFESRYLVPIDRTVEKIIQRYSIQTALAVSASPFPAIDMLLTIWRSTMMINEIAATYGVKPTLGNQICVFVKVARNAAYSGLSQVAIDRFIDLSDLPIAGKALTEALQGIGAGVAIARIGTYCAIICRPIRINDADTFSSKICQSVAIILGKKVIKARAGLEPFS